MRAQYLNRSGPMRAFLLYLSGRCALAEREDMVTVPRSLTVEVGTPTVLTWVDLPASVTEQEEAEFGCQAVGGYPRPSLEVTGPGSLRSGSQQSAGGRMAVYSNLI